MTDLNITWSEYHHKIETLAVKVYQSNWQFNQIICLAKGGLRVGDILCRLYDVPLAILSTASYGGEDNRDRGKIKFSQHISTIEPLGDRILLVDDLVDSGISLAESVKWLQTNYGENITDLRTAVIWYKSVSVKIPNYYVDYLSNSPWINQPFEKYEKTSISGLAREFCEDKVKQID
ncbi:phosphoribosyltransferase [Waterburya agarophytonicola K14]|uniref:Phosphoribosyltransferase n=1 Tax=Waterburya agarophytonicola KI4 TaxID=2874699 RepID=A0A964BNK2_9CYAN|nr:phosphoribosyltransferase [Waterburya agarophytonicola KI4]